MARFREATEIIHRMWTENYPTFSGKYYTIDKPINEPKGVQKPHPPLWLAGSGEKVTLKLVAQWGDGCNIVSTDPLVVRHKLDVLRQHCTTFDRNFDELTRSVDLSVYLVDSEATAEAETAAARKGEEFAHYASRVKVVTDTQLIALLESLISAGANYFIFYLERLGYDLSQMQRLASQVIPHFEWRKLVRLQETGPVLLPIDAVPQMTDLDPEQPILSPFDMDEAGVRASTRKLVELAQREGVALIVHGHDPEQWKTLKKAPKYYQ